MKLTCLIIFSFSIINVFSIKTLTKYGSLTSNEKYISFESDSFPIGEEMNFDIKAKEDCSDFLNYEYYNDSDDLQSLLLLIPTYSVEKSSVSSTGKKSNKTFTKYFTIEKKQSELGSSNGKNLLLYYECTSQYEIENTKLSGSTVTIIIVCIFVVIMIIVSIVFYCYRRKIRQNMKNRRMPGNYVVPYGGGANYPQPMYPYPQMPNNQMIYQNPQPINSSPLNVKVSNVKIFRNKGKKGEKSNDQSTSQRIINSQAFEKTHIQK